MARGALLLGMLVMVSCLEGCGGDEPMAAPAPRPIRDGAVDDEGVMGESPPRDAEVMPPEDPDNPVVGSWEHDTGSCSYTHTFDDEGEYRIDATSGERVVAEYEIAAPSSGDDRWRIDFTIITDNGVEDCEGQIIDEDGVSHTAYVEPVGDDRIDVYRTPTGGAAAFRWTRK